MILKIRHINFCFFICSSFFIGACQQEDVIPSEEPTTHVETPSTTITDSSGKKEIVYSDATYSLKVYKAERHPTVCRNGLGLDFYHLGVSTLDTMYLGYENLPAWHPNNSSAIGRTIIRSDSVEFQYDILFYNEYAYSQLSTGDYGASGYPVIFMYTNPLDDSKSTKAVMVGQGLSCFNAFTADSVTAQRIAALKSDPQVNLAAYRTEIHTATINGSVLLESSASALYGSLVIGNKFRPNIGGVFDLADVSDESQINYQPVFLIRTREGLYAKFMVTRFKGVGVDTQKLTLQWQALKTK